MLADSSSSPDSPDPVVSSPSGSQPATGETPPAPAGSTTPQAAPEATQFMDEHRDEVREVLARHASALGGQGGGAGASGTPGAPAGAQAAPNFADLFTKYGPLVMDLFALFQKYAAK